MTLVTEERPSDSPFVATITQGWTVGDGAPIRPAEIHWHMVLVRHTGGTTALVVGPLTTAGVATYSEGAEILWIKFKLGTYMPHLPLRQFLNSEIALPEAAGRAFWLRDSAWPFPDFENVETFLARLARADVLRRDPLVQAALSEPQPELASRTLRHRFLHSAGQTQNHIRQMQRAQQAQSLLEQGASILDTVHLAGYFDQPHLTRSLKQFIGYTPAQLVRRRAAACQSIQDAEPQPGYHTNVLKTG